VRSMRTRSPTALPLRSLDPIGISGVPTGLLMFDSSRLGQSWSYNLPTLSAKPSHRKPSSSAALRLACPCGFSVCTQAMKPPCTHCPGAISAKKLLSGIKTDPVSGPGPAWPCVIPVAGSDLV
jgi:hypothetical protein